MNTNKNQQFFLFLMPSFIFFILTVVVIKIHAVNVIYRDEWPMMQFLYKVFYQNNLTVKDLFAYFNEHRWVLVRFAYMLNFLIKPLDLTRLLYISYFLVFISSCIVLHLVGEEVKLNWPVAILLPAVFFSYTSGENLIFPIQIGFIMSVFFFILSLLSIVIIKNSSIRIISSFIFCILSLLSSVWGLSTFLAIAGYMILQQRKKQPEKSRNDILKIILWVISTFIVYIIYIQGYPVANQQYSFMHVLFNPLQSILYFAAIIGAFPDYILAKGAVEISMIMTGLIIGCSYFYIMIKKSKDYPILFTISTFGMLSALLVTLGRSHGGLDMANESRYLSLTMLLSLGLVLIASDMFRNKKYIILNSAIVIVILASIMALPREVASFHNRFAIAKEGLRNILIYNDYSDKEKVHRLFGEEKKGYTKKRQKMIMQYKQLKIQLKDIEKKPKIFKCVR